MGNPKDFTILGRLDLASKWIQESDQVRTNRQQAERIKELEIENAVLWKALTVTGKVYHFSDTSKNG